jgi:glutathione S-transferase
MPGDPVGEAETLQWTIAALNSIEMVTVPWAYVSWSGAADNPLTDWMERRLGQLEAVLADREWLAAGRFTVADLLMADVLRMPTVRGFGNRPASEAYVARMVARPTFARVHAEQMAQYAQADEGRALAD